MSLEARPTNAGYPPASATATSAARATSRVLVIATSPRDESVSTERASRAAERLARAGVLVTVVDLRTVSPFMAGTPISGYPADVRALESQARGADAIVIATGIHRDFVTGACMNVVCLVRDALVGTPVLVCAAAGSARAHGAVEAFRALLWGSYGADVLPAVLASPDVPDAALDERVDRQVDAMISRLEAWS